MSERSDRYRDLDAEGLAELGALIRNRRQAALATVDGAAPYAAMTAFAPTRGFDGFLLHLSDLSAHKWHLRACPRASLLIFEPDNGGSDVLQLRRLSVACSAAFLAKGTSVYESAARTYLDRFPKHQATFTLRDFDLVRLTPRSGLLNAGFGHAYRVTPDDLAAAAELAEPHESE